MWGTAAIGVSVLLGAITLSEILFPNVLAPGAINLLGKITDFLWRTGRACAGIIIDPFLRAWSWIKRTLWRLLKCLRRAILEIGRWIREVIWRRIWDALGNTLGVVYAAMRVCFAFPYGYLQAGLEKHPVYFTCASLILVTLVSFRYHLVSCFLDWLSNKGWVWMYSG